MKDRIYLVTNGGFYIDGPDWIRDRRNEVWGSNTVGRPTFSLGQAKKFGMWKKNPRVLKRMENLKPGEVMDVPGRMKVKNISDGKFYTDLRKRFVREVKEAERIFRMHAENLRKVDKTIKMNGFKP